VAAVGAGVTHVKEGDRLGALWLHTACGHCEHCLTGWETLCDSQQMTGYTVDGQGCLRIRLINIVNYSSKDKI
jgi:propanol-preferring alcohol dehydrogenase